jgi:nitrogen regulatory protein PII
MNNDEKLMFTVIIAGRKLKEALLTALLEADVHVIDSLFGHGTAKASWLENTLGLVHEKNKIVIFAVAKHERTEKVLAILKEEFHFEQAHTGIAFTVPIERLSF